LPTGKPPITSAASVYKNSSEESWTIEIVPSFISLIASAIELMALFVVGNWLHFFDLLLKKHRFDFA